MSKMSPVISTGFDPARALHNIGDLPTSGGFPRQPARYGEMLTRRVIVAADTASDEALLLSKAHSLSCCFSMIFAHEQR
jgi:hypothetical protein